LEDIGEERRRWNDPGGKHQAGRDRNRLSRGNMSLGQLMSLDEGGANAQIA
jgi:hypothetical protein